VLVDHDLHIHTHLSACSCDETATPENIIARAAERGLATIGFADHMWDSRSPAASEWYRAQDYPHISQSRNHIPDDTRGLRVLVGCETDYCGGGRVGISHEVAERLDFVLMATSHLHMIGYTVPWRPQTAKEIALLMAEWFREALDLGLATGMAHPFLPLGYKQNTDAVLDCISDGEFQDLFGLAAEQGVSIEVSVCCFPGCGAGELPGFHDEAFLRVLSLAREAGCVFHFASDTHTLEGVGDSLKLEPYARAVGITREDILPLVRREG